MKKTDNIKLTYCDLGIAYQCNFKCKTCEFWKNSPLNKDNVLSIEQWKNVLDQLSELVDKQICTINLSGPGEPLLRDNIFDLIKHGRDLGLKIQIISNGFCVNKQIAADIAASGLKFISFSLDSLNPETHNYLRGKDNAFEYVMRAIDNISLACPDICIGINTVISKVNLNEIIELTQWVENDKRLAYINFQAIAQPFSYHQAADIEWFKKLEYQQLWPDDKKVIEQTIAQLIEFKQKGYKLSDDISQLKVFKQYFLDPLTFIKKTRCNLAKVGVLNIDPAGNVSKCQMVGIIDNIKGEKNLKQICLSEEAEKHIALINNCQRNCHLVVSCHFCSE
ncbi:MAG: radical SAM protein [Candidatus Omnitrophica bacterium]|nr:radical SAM protein [Candidatus Omnitrophota bacterium]